MGKILLIMAIILFIVSIFFVFHFFQEPIQYKNGADKKQKFTPQKFLGEILKK